MNRREIIPQNGLNIKRQKTSSELTRWIDNLIPDILVTSFEESPFPSFSVVENILYPPEHNNTTLSTCTSNEIREDVYDVENFTVNLSTKFALREQRSSKERDFSAILVPDQDHINKLPVELLTDTFDYLSLEDLLPFAKHPHGGDK